MKKTIAILMVLAIVAGLVFAGTATLSVKSLVANKYPGFKLSGTDQATSGATGNASYASGWYDDENAEFAEGIAHGVYVDGSGTINAVNSIAEKDIIVWFTLSQSGSEGVGDSNSRYAKLGRTFDFDITVGNMTLRNAADTAYVASPSENQTVAPVDADSGQSIITYTKASVTAGNELTILDSTAEDMGTSEFRVIYNGTVQDGQEIGTFKVKWPKKATLEEGKYQADVVVTITT